MLWRRFTNAIVEKVLLLKKGAVLKTTGTDGVVTEVTAEDLAAAANLSGLTATVAELNSVCDANTATAAEITRVADASTRVVHTTATSLSLTVTQHADRVVLLDASSTTNIFTLPAAGGTGEKFTIVNAFPQTQGTVVVSAASTADVMSGIAVNVDATGAGSSKAFWTTATDRVVTLNLTTTGGPVGGDMVEAWDSAAGVWTVKVLQISSGSLATPFSAT